MIKDSKSLRRSIDKLGDYVQRMCATDSPDEVFLMYSFSSRCLMEICDYHRNRLKEQS